MKSSWSRLIRFLSLGIPAEMDEDARKSALYTQGLSLFFIIASLPYPLVYILNGLPLYTWLSLGMLILNIFIFYVGAIGNTKLARTLLLLFLNLSVLFTASLWGDNINLKYGFLIFMILPLLLYPIRELKSILAFQILPIISFLLLHFGAFYYLDWLKVNPEEAQMLMRFVDVSIITIFCSLLVLLIYDQYLSKTKEQRIYVEAQKVLEAKTRFFSTISHEIRTPLNSLIGLVELMEHTEQNEEQAEYSRVIKLSAESLMSVVNGVLDYSQIEADNLELEELPFSLSQTIREVVDMLNIRAQKRGYEIQSKIDESLKRNLKGDPKRLKQILINLIGNAVKFTYEGGIFVTVEDIGLDDQKQMVRVSVRDTGIGIPEEKISHLFNPYTQLNRSFPEEGTGLGLAITWELVHLMGGKIWVDSQKGKGTTFAFELGFRTLETGILMGKPFEAKVSQREKLNILLVEDNIVNQKVVVRMLEKLGFQADLVANGLAAVEAASEKQYDLILMDLELPVLNGIEATKQILHRCRERSAKSLCPLVIALTANTTVEYQHQCLASGMQDFLAKPVRTEELQQMIFSWFPQANTLSEA